MDAKALDAVLAPLRADPSTAAVCCDFDGTLSPIVDDPGTARPLDGVAGTLDELAGRYAVVAVVSGRPVAFLERFLPASVRLSGLYGLESSFGGERADHVEAAVWRGVVADAVTAARTGLPDGVHVESKGLSLTLHFRTRPDLAVTARAWAEDQAAATGLDARPAKMSVELHPPVDVDKGSAVAALVAGMRAGCFVGDDVGDLPAFRALDGIDGLEAAVRIAVRGVDAAPEVLAAADAVVDGPAGALALLRAL